MTRQGKEGFAKAVGQRIEALMERKGWTQKEFAARIGAKMGQTMSPSAVGNYISGRRTPPPNVLPILADLLDTSVDYLLGRQEEKMAEAGPLLLDDFLQEGKIMFQGRVFTKEELELVNKQLELIIEMKKRKDQA